MRGRDHAHIRLNLQKRSLDEALSVHLHQFQRTDAADLLCIDSHRQLPHGRSCALHRRLLDARFKTLNLDLVVPRGRELCVPNERSWGDEIGESEWAID